MSTITIRQVSPDLPDAVTLIDELETHLASLYPIESRHGFAVEKLIQEQVAFYVAWLDQTPAGCGGIKLFDRDYGELKRMYVRPDHRGQGLGRRLIDVLAGHARQNQVRLLRLETGIYQTEAIGLYERYGFRRIPPFGNYTDDPLSLCYEMQLD